MLGQTIVMMSTAPGPPKARGPTPPSPLLKPISAAQVSFRLTFAVCLPRGFNFRSIFSRLTLTRTISLTSDLIVHDVVHTQVLFIHTCLVYAGSRSQSAHPPGPKLVW
jgi:hypothetical protein